MLRNQQTTLGLRERHDARPLFAMPCRGIGGIVREVFIVHVGGTCCVTSSTDNIMKIHARITLTVECIRTCIFLFWFYVEIQGRVWSRLTFFFDFTDVQVRPWSLAQQVSLWYTCWWYSLCNFQYRPQYEHTGSDHCDCGMYTCIFLCWFDVSIQSRVWIRTHLFSNVLIFR